MVRVLRMILPAPFFERIQRGQDRLSYIKKFGVNLLEFVSWFIFFEICVHLGGMVSLWLVYMVGGKNAVVVFGAKFSETENFLFSSWDSSHAIIMGMMILVTLTCFTCATWVNNFLWDRIRGRCYDNGKNLL